MMNNIIITVDLEYDWESEKIDNILLLPKLLDFFDDFDVNATFFVLGEIIKEFENIIKEISKKHEIASHGFSHVKLKKLDNNSLVREVSLTKGILEDMRIPCLGFRSPYFLPPRNLGLILENFGYKYDSSISKGILWGRHNNFFVPEKPYRVANHDISERGNGIIEIPVSNFSFLNMPLGLPFFRLCKKFHFPLSIPKNNPLIFYMHPYELLNSKPGKEINFLYRQLYKLNNGGKAWKILEDFFSTNHKFISCRQFIKKGFKNEK